MERSCQVQLHAIMRTAAGATNPGMQRLEQGCGSALHEEGYRAGK